MGTCTFNLTIYNPHSSPPPPSLSLNTYTSTHTHTRARAHTHTHTYTDTDTHAHTHIPLPCFLSLCPFHPVPQTHHNYYPHKDTQTTYWPGAFIAEVPQHWESSHCVGVCLLLLLLFLLIGLPLAFICWLLVLFIKQTLHFLRRLLQSVCAGFFISILLCVVLLIESWWSQAGLLDLFGLLGLFWSVKILWGSLLFGCFVRLSAQLQFTCTAFRTITLMQKTTTTTTPNPLLLLYKILMQRKISVWQPWDSESLEPFTFSNNFVESGVALVRVHLPWLHEPHLFLVKRLHEKTVWLFQLCTYVYNLSKPWILYRHNHYSLYTETHSNRKKNNNKDKRQINTDL